MQHIEKKWQIYEKIPEYVYHDLNGYHPVLRQILYNRGYTNRHEAEKYIHAETELDTDPFRLKGMETAVDRIEKAIEEGEAIAIYGDYDVDGVTATALLTEVLSSAGANVEGYIPNRFEDGYGLNIDAISDLKSRGKELIITVDCGIRSPAEVEFANSLGMDVIISDHHHPADILPEAVSVINPKQEGDRYPYKDLAGVGLAYKIACAVFDPLDPIVENTLDLVALGTVADLTPLVGENRSLVSAGIGRIREPHRQGLISLIGAAMIDSRKITASDIGFTLGPRLNAAGRLDTASKAFELLITDDLKLAALRAQELDDDNRQRQRITRFVQEDAEERAIADNPDGNLLFAASSEYNMGVVGLAASRLTERYYRPSIVAHQSEEFTRGSCRSIPEFHITDALDRCAELLVRHGGHAAAAGFTVRTDKLEEFKSRITEISDEILGDQDLRPVLKADIDVELSELRPELLEYLGWLEPTGKGNPRAKFVSRNLGVVWPKKVGKDGSHLKMSVTDRKITYDAIAFRQGHWLDNMPPRVDLLYSFEKNEYQGRVNLQLNVQDIKPSQRG